MGRGIRSNELIKNNNERGLTFKKRRIGLVKKAMQLNLITQCEISLKIFYKEDGSLLEYNSAEQPVSELEDTIKQHAKFVNKDFELLEQLEHLTNKHGHMFSGGEEITNRMYSELEGFNFLQLFTLGNGKGSNQNTLLKCK